MCANVEGTFIKKVIRTGSWDILPICFTRTIKACNSNSEEVLNFFFAVINSAAAAVLLWWYHDNNNQNYNISYSAFRISEEILCKIPSLAHYITDKILALHLSTNYLWKALESFFPPVRLSKPQRWLWCKMGREDIGTSKYGFSANAVVHKMMFSNKVCATQTFYALFRYWTFSNNERLCYLKNARPTLRQTERGSFISGSTLDNGCGKNINAFPRA